MMHGIISRDTKARGGVLRRLRMLFTMLLVTTLAFPLAVPPTASAATMRFTTTLIERNGVPYEPITGMITGNGYPIPVPMTTKYFYGVVGDPSAVAYCLTAGWPNPGDRTYPESYVPNDLVKYVLINGYPNTTTIGGIPLSEDAARVVTQVALWVVLDQVRMWDIKLVPGHSDSIFVRQALWDLVNDAWNSRLPDPISIDLPTIGGVEWVDSDYRRVGPITVTAGYGLASTEVVVRDIPGAFVADARGAWTSPTSGQPFYVHIPASAVVRPGSLTLDATVRYEIPSIVAWVPPTGVRAQDMLAYTAPSVETYKTSSRIDWGQITVAKVDDVSGIGIPDTEFQIRSGGAPLESRTTDSDGIVTFPGLGWGTYEIVEKASNPAYEAPEPGSPASRRTVVLGSSDPAPRIEWANTAITGSLRIIKSDALDSTGIPGITFAVERESPPGAWTEIARGETDQSGELTIKGLPVRSSLDTAPLRLREVSSSGRHHLPSAHGESDTWEVGLTVENPNAVMNLTNQPYRSIEIFKEDDTTNTRLAGATFEIHRTDGSPVGRITTDDAGLATSDLLTFGSYRIREVEAPRGYAASDTIDEVELNVASPASVRITRTNTRVTGSVALTKHSSGRDGRPLEGATFEIHRIEDSPDRIAWFDPVRTSDDAVAIITTDARGEARADGLEYGSYYLVEVQAPRGHAPDPMKRYFEVREQGEVIVFDVVNEVLDLDHGGVMLRFRHIWDTTEIAPAWGFNAEIGSTYRPQLMASGHDKKAVDGFTFVRADYPVEERLVDGKLLVTYWYKKDVAPGWAPIVKTGDDGRTYLPREEGERLGLLSREELHRRLLQAREANPDVIGYLTIPGTGLAEPVVQTSDNTTYLYQDSRGQRTIRGAIFADHRSAPYIGADEGPTILHGHNMRDGSMFGILSRYADPKFLAAHPVVQYVDATGRGGTWVIYSAHPADGSDPALEFPRALDAGQYQRQALRRSLITTGLESIAEGDLLTLSTCAYHAEDGKLLIHALLLDEPVVRR